MFKRLGVRIAALAKAGGKWIPALLRDVVGVVAVGLIAYGFWLWYQPAGFIVAGVLLLAGVLLISRKAG